MIRKRITSKCSLNCAEQFESNW